MDCGQVETEEKSDTDHGEGDGELYMWGSGYSVSWLPQKVKGLEAGRVTQVSLGGMHTVALVWSGEPGHEKSSVYTWGNNIHGQVSLIILLLSF